MSEGTSQVRQRGGPIVCGLDASPLAQNVAAVAASLASRLNRHLLLVNVAPEPSVPDRPSATYSERQHEAEEFERTAQMQVLLGAIEVGDRADASRIVEFGQPHKVLAETAEATGALLIVVGRGVGRFDRLVLGSTSAALIQEAPCPLVVVPAGVSLESGNAIVCGVDGSRAALATVRCASELAGRLELRLILVNAHDGSGDPGTLKFADDAAREHLDKDSIELVSVRGDAAEALASQVAAFDALFLAVGTRAQGSLRSVALGSVTEALVRTADRPVLVVPPGMSG